MSEFSIRKKQPKVRISNTYVSKATADYVKKAIYHGFGNSKGEIFDIAVRALVEQCPECIAEPKESEFN